MYKQGITLVLARCCTIRALIVRFIDLHQAKERSSQPIEISFFAFLYLYDENAVGLNLDLLSASYAIVVLGNLSNSTTSTFPQVAQPAICRIYPYVQLSVTQSSSI